MAIGNPLHGNLRGRIGDVVFARKAGKQMSRSYVASPANPKTKSQCGQRVKFATCAAFYRMAVQNGFKFAYEDKKVNESDYNAFLRHNVKVAVPQTRLTLSQACVPIGNWLMSKGSLESPTVAYDSLTTGYNTWYLKIQEGTVSSSNTTIGMISRALMHMYDLQDGDFVTVVSCYSNQLVASNLNAAKEQGGMSIANTYPQLSWDLAQIKIDSTSTTPVTDEFPFQYASSKPSRLFTKFSFVPAVTNYSACAIIFSRVTKDGVKVSTSELHVINKDQIAANYGQTEEWWQFCADSFKSASSLENKATDILKGSESYN